MKDKSTIIRAITSDGGARIAFIDSTAIVRTAGEKHGTSKTMTAVLGRALTGASLMGSLLKNSTDSLTLRFDGDGPCGSIVCVSDYKGNVRGYAEDMTVELPPNKYGKLDVGRAVGGGTMYVIRDLGMNEPYIGASPIISGEIAEDITSYFANSEQTPSVCALGVRVGTDNVCFAAGGYLLQLLPGAEAEIAEKLENNIRLMRPVSELIAGGAKGEDIIGAVFGGLEFEMFDEFDAEYLCTCEREKYLGAIAGLSADDLDELLEKGEPIEAVCRFCGEKYVFSPDEVKAEVEKKKSK